MKILIVHDSSKIGGAERSLLELCFQLNQIPNVQLVLCLPNNGKLFSEFTHHFKEVEELPYVHLAKKWNPIYLIKTFLKKKDYTKRLNKLIEKYQPDLIHANSFKSAVLCYDSVANSKIKFTFHQRDSIRVPRLAKRIVDKAQRVFCISKFIQMQMLPYVTSEEKLLCVYNGIDISLFTDVSLPELKRKHNKKLVLMVAQFAAWKGQKDFINMAELLHKDLSDVSFLLIGNTMDASQQAYANELKELVKKKELDDVIEISTSPESMQDLCAKADCLVSCSNDEPFGRALVEAMAASLPVVAPHSGALPEIIEHQQNGMLYPLHDIEKLCHAVEFCLTDNNKVESMIQSAYHKVKNNFNLKDQAEEFYRHISVVVSES